MPWFMALKTLPWKWIAIVGGLLIVFVIGWQQGHKRVPELKRELAAEQACEPETQCAGRLQAIATERERQALINAKVSADVVSDYENEIERLRNQPERVRVVRVRIPAANSGDVRVPDTACTTDGTGTAGGLLHADVGGADLYRLAREADEVSARLRALQAWNRSIAEPAQ